MPPKRNIKPNKTKPPQLPQLSNEKSPESLEAELRFDNEVLWCVCQFEKLIKSGKINDAKKHESMKAIMMLKKTNVSKIEKIQLMKSYFKDYKAKMQKDEDEMKKVASLNFENTHDLKSNGKFLKKKTTDDGSKKQSEFFFNFNSGVKNSDDILSQSVNSISLS